MSNLSAISSTDRGRSRTSRRIARLRGSARAWKAGTLAVEVPVNDYPTAESFAAALESFGSMVSNVELLAAMSDGNQAMLLYDLEAGPIGRLRVAEHFTVEGGKITRIRQIHDTAAVHAGGLAG
jgi:hypothetical protein